METQKFEHWAIVEVMGHAKFAGWVTNQALGGASLIRVDVPAVGGRQAFTKLFGAGSIYCISIVTEAVARAVAESLRNEPVHAWDLPKRELIGSDAKCGHGTDPDDYDDI